MKESFTNYSANGGPNILTNKTFYIRDAAGTPMAVYTSSFLNNNHRPVLKEHTVYGASRLGVYKRQNAKTNYELTDHLGNVRAVVSWSENEIAKTGTDYYPFGMPMPLRNSLSDYRYAYQGQEKDSETGKEAFELRLWDARIGRWLTTDPYGQFHSPYLGMGNNPISSIDPDGGWVKGAGLWKNLTQSDERIFFDQAKALDPFGCADCFGNSGVLIEGGRSSKKINPIDFAFSRGTGFAQLWRQNGFFEIGFNTIEGQLIEVKLTKSLQFSLGDKKIPFSVKFNNVEGIKVARGIENNDKEFSLGLGTGVGGQVKIVDKPDGNVELGAGVGCNVLEVEHIYAIDADQHGNHHSTFIGININPGLAIFLGAEAQFKIGFKFDN